MTGTSSYEGVRQTDSEECEKQGKTKALNARGGIATTQLMSKPTIRREGEQCTPSTSNPLKPLA